MQSSLHYDSERKDARDSREVKIPPMPFLRSKGEASLQGLVFYDGKDEPGGL